MNKTEKIIIIVVILAIICAIVVTNIKKNSQKFVYYLSKSDKVENQLVENYKSLSKIVKDSRINSNITNQIDFSKSTIEDVFNENYFETKKVVLVATFADTSRDYIYSVDSLEYNKERTEVIIHYTDKVGEYAGMLSNSWYNCFLIEVDGTVTSVKFDRTSK